MSELEYRELIIGYLNDTYSLEELMNIVEICRCVTCGAYMLEEDAHTYEGSHEEGEKYCDTCWEAGF